MERADPKSIEYIDGIAIHYYGNFFPGAILTRLQNQYPDKILLSTEACEGNGYGWRKHDFVFFDEKKFVYAMWLAHGNTKTS